MAHIYSGSRLRLGLAQEYRLLLPGTYHYAPHTTLQKYHHYKYDIILVSISFHQFPPPQCKLSILLYILPKDNVHKCIQYNHNFSTYGNRSIIPGV